MTYFDKLLVANRGEIAIRVMRACRELGIESLAIYSDADKNALHVHYADEAFSVGASPPSQSYLNVDKILKVAHAAGAEAIHPGYGFLAENAEFAARCEKEGICFIGPSSSSIAMMGSKIACKQKMKDAGVPVLPGTDGGVTDADQAARTADTIGYPVIIKASAGGGGIGMHIVNSPEELTEAIEKSMRIAESAFGDNTVFVEKYLEKPRHIEVQVLCDQHNDREHLYERECSIQRRHQKLVEEAPCPIMTDDLREMMTESALRVAEVSRYVNAGTVEFLYSNGEYYFMEMNTRLQVEHTVTELITGIDIVKEQIAIAAGEPLMFPQETITIRGHAIECRINAEDPINNFSADPGKITRYRSPGGPGIRVDSGIHQGYSIPPYYDSMIAKLCAWGMTRDFAIARMKRAIYEYVILGIKTTLPLHHAIMHNPDYITGNTHTHFLQEPHIQKTLKRYIQEDETRMNQLSTPLRSEKKIAAVAAGVQAYISQGKSL
ncbi:MAG: acetyl-CoA carboxylase biotin carboxylase subunit [Methanospirillaceae archaeon]|nr:acetyl-CoA carboxylase biotin carboxylase subunit [Methanospirillaceae archaeon]